MQAIEALGEHLGPEDFNNKGQIEISSKKLQILQTIGKIAFVNSETIENMSPENPQNSYGYIIVGEAGWYGFVGLTKYLWQRGQEPSLSWTIFS